MPRLGDVSQSESATTLTFADTPAGELKPDVFVPLASPHCRGVVLALLSLALLHFRGVVAALLSGVRPKSDAGDECMLEASDSFEGLVSSSKTI